MTTETNAERLRALKDAHNRRVRLSSDSITWLIKQVERVQELEETLTFYADVNNHPIVFTAIERDGGYKARKELGRLEAWEIERE